MERSTSNELQIGARPRRKSPGRRAAAVQPTAKQSVAAEYSQLDELGGKRKTPLSDRIASAEEQAVVDRSEEPTVEVFRRALVAREPVEEEEHSDLKSFAHRLASLVHGAMGDLAWRVS